MIRDWTPEDAAFVRQVHFDSGFDYQLPAMNTPLYPIRRAGVEDGRSYIAAAVKVTAEVYLWLDHEWGTPQERLEALQELHADVTEKARTLGFDQLYVCIPPEIAKSFGPRLRDLGWELARPWPVYTFELREKVYA